MTTIEVTIGKIGEEMSAKTLIDRLQRLMKFPQTITIRVNGVITA